MMESSGRADRPENCPPLESSFLSIAEKLPVQVWMIRQGKVVWTNAAVREFTGLSVDAISADQRALVHPDDVASVASALERTFTTGELFHSEFRMRRFDRGYAWMAVRARPVRDAEGRIDSWIGVAIDIDEQTRALTLLDTLFKEAPVGLVLVDRDLRHVRINAAAAAITGVPAEEFLGRTVAEVAPEMWSQLEPHARRMLSGEEQILNLELASERPDSEGELHDWMSTYFPVRVRDEVIGFGAVMVDVTEHRRMELAVARVAEERRALLADLLPAQERAQRRLAADIHGDTLQVFAAVRLKLEQLGESLHDPAQRAIFEECETACVAAQQRMRDLLFELWPPSLERSGLAEAITELLARVATESGLRTRLDSDLGADVPVELGGTVFRVLTEALSNVTRHARASSVEVELSERGGELCARVTDDGAGFDPSGAVDPGHIGLLEMRERVESVGGRISIVSAPGKGTSVEVDVPIERETAAGRGRLREAASGASLRPPPPRGRSRPASHRRVAGES